MTITILIVDDQIFTRKALQTMLEQERDFQIIGQAANGIEALKFIEHQKPNIALVDLEMPEMNGYSLTYQVAQRFAQTKVVIFSACEEKDSIDTAIKAGARGYLLKTTSGTEIADTIRYVQRGYFQLGPGLFEKIVSDPNAPAPLTSEELYRFENKAQKSFENWETEMMRKNELVQRELFRELENQVANLKQDFRQGLELFQQQVSDRMSRGLNFVDSSFDRTKNDGNLWEKEFSAREFERQQHVNRILTGTRKSIVHLENKINFLRNCLVLLAVSFVAETIVMLVF